MCRIRHKYFELILVPLLFITIFTIGSSNIAQSANAETIYVIANKSFPTDSLAPSQIKRIFLKKQKTIKGKSVVPINARKHSVLRKAFAQRVLQMSAADELAYWEDTKMKEGIPLPPEVSNSMRAVFGIPYSISYCFKSDYKPNIAKILLKI